MYLFALGRGYQVIIIDGVFYMLLLRMNEKFIARHHQLGSGRKVRNGHGKVVDTSLFSAY